MPALQSPWFAPHVIVYMFAYALLGAATLMAVWMLIKHDERPVNAVDSLVYVSELFGQKRRGDTTGRGIPKRHGRPSHGLPI